jgi:FK506-binding nuclear protein
MNTKTIVIAIIVIILIGGAGYVVYSATNNNSIANSQTQTTTSTATSTTPQVQGQDVKVGAGASAVLGSKVSVLYVAYLGRISTSTIFDSSAAHNNQPYVFLLGTTTVPNSPILGFQIGVNGMKEGGERLLAIPPTLGYGNNDIKDANGKVIIPANSTLVFDVELLKVESATASPAKTK